MSYEQDPNEQANSSGADLAILMDELAEFRAAYEQVTKDCWNLTEKVIPNIRAESQVREKVLRDALRQIEACTSEEGCLMGPLGLVTTAARALNQPSDDSALKAALATERERIASHFDGKDEMFGDTIADAIRALGE